MLVLLFGALQFILLGDLLCHFVLVFFSPFSIAITSLGEERANLSAFGMFDQFVPHLGKRELILVLLVCLINLCLFGFVGFLFLLMSGKGCGL